MRSLKEEYDLCISEGLILKQEEINKGKIGRILSLAESSLKAAHSLEEINLKKEISWEVVYDIYYDALREVVSCYLAFDFVKILNHKRLFACLCFNHPDLELSWDFFEKTRTKRNNIKYYGENISYQEFKSLKVQLNLYIEFLKKEIQSKFSKL